jgi:hypothetical protein
MKPQRLREQQTNKQTNKDHKMIEWAETSRRRRGKKRQISSDAGIPNKVLPGQIACLWRLSLTPVGEGVAAALAVVNLCTQPATSVSSATDRSELSKTANAAEHTKID